MMTKKHFEAIAGILNEFTRYNESRLFAGGSEVDGMISVIVNRFADYLETQNDNFDRDRFFNASYKDYLS